MPTTSDQNEVKGRFRAWVKDWQEAFQILKYHPLFAGPRAAFFTLLFLFFLIDYSQGFGTALIVYILGNIFFVLLTMFAYMLERDQKEKDKE